MEFILSNLPAFVTGNITGAVILFLVYHNNQKLFNEKFDELQNKSSQEYAALKAEYDKVMQDTKTAQLVDQRLKELGLIK